MQKRTNFSPIATSIEQSERLMKAGIDTKSADMCYANMELNPYYSPDIRLSAFAYAEAYDIYKRIGFNAEALAPAWSLSALWTLCKDKQLNFDTDINSAEEVMQTLVNALTK